MARTSSRISPWLYIEKEKSVIWLDTYYYKCTPLNILNMGEESVWKFQVETPMFVDITLEFHFVRVSDLEFRIICHQSIPKTSSLADYTLRFHISMNIFKEDPKVLEMESDEPTVFVNFHLNPSYLQDLSSRVLNKTLKIKIIANMIEYDCQQCLKHLNEEEEFRKMNEYVLNDEAVLKNLCYIMQIPGFYGIFTGRQNNDFTALKSFYINRTAALSVEIANYFKAKESRSAVPQIDLGVILNKIYNKNAYGREEPITNNALFNVYYDAYYVGLPFLKDLCRDCILERLQNMDVMHTDVLDMTYWVDVLEAADRVGDDVLFDKLAKMYHSLKDDFSKPRKLLKNMQKSSIQCAFVVQSLKRKLKEIGPSRPCNVGNISA